MGKIIFLDVDGTLVSYEMGIPQSAIEAIRKARENGHKVYINTGRSKAEVYQNIWDIGLDGMIGGNGSYVEDNGNVIMHQLITYDQCVRIVDWLHSRKLEFYLESNNGLFASEHFKEACESTIQEYSRSKGKANADKITVDQAFPEMIYNGTLYRDDLNKVSYKLESYQDYLDTKEQFPELENNTWGGRGETALFGDIGVKGVTKSHAVDVLLKHLNAKWEDTIAFGDAKIDVDMMEYCAIGVAMGNGGPECKACADYITSDVDDNGIYNAFKHFGLID